MPRPAESPRASTSTVVHADGDDRVGAVPAGRATHRAGDLPSAPPDPLPAEGSQRSAIRGRPQPIRTRSMKSSPVVHSKWASVTLSTSSGRVSSSSKSDNSPAVASPNLRVTCRRKTIA